MPAPKRNPVGWFEIPVNDMKRAVTFYETVLSMKMDVRPNVGLEMAWFPAAMENAGAAGALVRHEQWYKPSMDGTLVYFSSPSGNLDNELALVEKAGGKVWVQKKPIGEYGFIGVFTDTEGNRVALHSMA